MTFSMGPRGCRCLALGALGLASCGGRDADVTAPIDDGEPLGLERAVVLPDDALSRVVVLTSSGPDELSRAPLPVGQNIASLRPDVTGHGVLVLSSGVQPRRQADDELPSLTLIDTSEEPEVTARYELTEPFGSVTLDPDLEDRWAVLSGASGNFVTNPNQLVLIKLSDQISSPSPRPFAASELLPIAFASPKRSTSRAASGAS
jgi:hypothetical protein